MRKRISALDGVLLALCLALTLGVAFVFRACDAHDDGSFMTCHWAGQAVLGLGAAMSAMALLRLLLGDRARLGSDIGLFCCAVATAVLPGGLIGLCMMASMRCRAVMRPAVLVLSALIAVCAVIDGALALRRGKAA